MSMIVLSTQVMPISCVWSDQTTTDLAWMMHTIAIPRCTQTRQHIQTFAGEVRECHSALLTR